MIPLFLKAQGLSISKVEINLNFCSGNSRPEYFRPNNFLKRVSHWSITGSSRKPFWKARALVGFKTPEWIRLKTEGILRIVKTEKNRRRTNQTTNQIHPGQEKYTSGHSAGNVRFPFLRFLFQTAGHWNKCRKASVNRFGP